MLADNDERCVTIPMTNAARSLNLAVAVGAAVFEARRQFAGKRLFNPAGRLHCYPQTMFLTASNLRRSFRLGSRTIEVLRGISLEVERGECVFLCGASGAGKTTLLYTLAGLERPENGTVFLDGMQLYKGNETAQAHIRNRRIGFVFQGYFLLPELTALENAMLPAMIGKRPDPAAARAALDGWGSETGCSICRRSYPAASSSAWQSPGP